MTRAQLKWGYCTALRLLGQEARLLERLRRERGMTVLNLHRVSPEANPFWNPMHPRVFEELVTFLKRRVRLVTFRELPAADNGRPLAVLSFDDGYGDFVEYAMPLLRKHGVAANLNIIPACVESGAPPWHMRLYDFLNAAPRALINSIRLPGFAGRLAGDHVDQKMRYGLALSRFLADRPQQERRTLWPALEAAMARLGPHPATRMMTLDDIRDAARDHQIGVHSYSHESMDHESLAFFEDDLTRCQAFFQATLGLPLTTYAFPNGSYRPEHLAILAQRGIRQALLVEERLASPGGLPAPNGGAVTYPRLTLYGESASEVRLQALGYRARGASGSCA